MFKQVENINPRIASRWGWGLTSLVGLFLTMDSAIKLIKFEEVTQSFHHLGYSDTLSRGLGSLEALILLLYIVPRTSVLGAILLTALLGGAVASHVRIESPLFTHVLFGVYVGVLAWAGLYLRDRRLRELVPLRA
jgi:hypothetical protein